jgi:hypothetical protein
MVLPEPCVDQLVRAFIVVASPEHRTAPDVIRVQSQNQKHSQATIKPSFSELKSSHSQSQKHYEATLNPKSQLER